MAAIKIPRDTSSSLINLPKTRISSSVGDVIGPNIDKLTAFLDQTAKAKHANDIRLEALRVNDKVSAKKSILEGMGIKFIQNLKEMEEMPSPENMEKLMKNHKMSVDAQVNKWNQGDSNFKSAFEGDHLSVLNSTREEMYKEKNLKILLNGVKVWDLYKIDRSKKIDKLRGQPSSALWAAYEAMSQELDGKLDSANANGFIQGLDNQKERHELLLEFGKIAASAGFLRTVENLDGTVSQEVDNLAVLKSLTAVGEPEFDAEGLNQISGKRNLYYGIDISSIRDELIEHFDTASTEQTNTEIKENIERIENLYKKYEDSALDGSLNIDIMKNDYWPKTIEAQDVVKALIGITTLARNGELATESNVTELKEISNLIQDRTVTSRYQKFWLPSEIGREDELMKNDKYSYDINGASVADRLGKTIGTSHIEMLQKLLTLDDSERLLLEQFNRWFTSVTPLIEGKLKQWDILSEYDVGQAELVIRERFWKGLREGKNPNDLLTEGKKDYIFADLDAWRITITEQAERIAQLLGNDTRIVNTSGKTITVPDNEYNGPVIDRKIYPNTEEGNNAWFKSETMQKWIYEDYPNNEKFSKNYLKWNRKFTTPPVLMSEYHKKSKIQRMETVDNQIEKDAIYYGIDYELVPKPPEGFSGKLFQWTKLFKEQHPDAITLRELKELVEKEKIHRISKKVKQKKVLKSDDRIETKILDNDKRFKKKEDGFYYWIIDGKVSNIKVNPDQVK